MLHYPCILGGPQRRRAKPKRAQKWAEMLHHPNEGGQNQSGPKRGRKCYITPAFSGVPK